MKTFFLLTSLFIASVAIQAQIIVENPDVGFSNAQNVTIKKVEINDSVTIIDFHTKQRAGIWIRIPKSTYIQVEGGEKLYIKSTTGIPLDVEYVVDEQGFVEYQTIFPAINAETKKFDYGEDGANNAWKIFDIYLIDIEIILPIPKALIGNWKNKENGDFIYGFYKNKAVFDNKVWDYYSFEGKAKNGEIVLSREDEMYQLFVKLKKDSTCLIGEDKKELTLCYQKPWVNIEKEEAKLELPVFKFDTAVYSGFIRGYSPKFGQKTGTVHVNNILCGTQDSHVLTIDEDGYYTVKIPMYYPHSVFVRLPNYYGAVFLEPGKEVFHLINNEEDKSIFMGELSKVNEDLRKTSNLRQYDYRDMRNRILDMTPEDYKKYCFDLMEKEQGIIDSMYEGGKLSEKSYQVKCFDITYGYHSRAMSYRMNFESAYRDKNKVPRNQRNLDIEIEEPGVEYYNFITPELANNKLAVISTEFDTYHNRLQFLPIVRDRNSSIYFSDILIELAQIGTGFIDKELEVIKEFGEIEELGKTIGQREFQKTYGRQYYSFQRKNSELFKKYQQENNEFSYTGLKTFIQEKGVDLSKEEIEMLDKMEENSQTEYSKKSAEFYKNNGDVYKEIYQKKQDEIKKYIQQMHVDKRNDNLKDKLNIDKGFATDVMYAEEVCRKIVEEKTPVSEDDLKQIQNNLESPFIKNYVEQMNNNTLAYLEANKSKTGYVINDVPKTDGEKLFDTILEKYKGKVVLVDFWATWCGPCRSSMQRIKPLKFEMADKDVAFVYITNPSSPENTYKNMIPDIPGEHYRVSQDEWNYLCQQFNISGIPHYTLVGKNGEIINPHLSHGMSNTALKALFEKHMIE